MTYDRITPQQEQIANEILHAQFCREKGCTHPVHQRMRPVEREPMSYQEQAKLDGIVDRHDRNLELNRRML